jgi:hypothetical protein
LLALTMKANAREKRETEVVPERGLEPPRP